MERTAKKHLQELCDASSRVRLDHNITEAIFSQSIRLTRLPLINHRNQNSLLYMERERYACPWVLIPILHTRLGSQGGAIRGCRDKAEAPYSGFGTDDTHPARY